MIREALAEIVEGRSLSTERAGAVMEFILRGEATPSQIAGFAVALRMKGETIEEIVGLARAMRAAAVPLPLGDTIRRSELLDTCGTGGDGAHTFNVSTAVALVAAGAGARVAKHGNRAVSSACGSADVLEHLGVHLDLTPERHVELLREIGITFLFAPQFHGALRHAATPRREMGLRTVFNVLGPLSNPAGAGRQLIGVFEEHWVERLAAVLAELGTESACVVHSEDGLDEISAFAPSKLAWVRGGTVHVERIDPADLGLAADDARAVRGRSIEESAALLRAVLTGEDGVPRRLVVLNAAAALAVAGLAEDLREGVSRAQDALDRGEALARLEALVAATGHD